MAERARRVDLRATTPGNENLGAVCAVVGRRGAPLSRGQSVSSSRQLADAVANSTTLSTMGSSPTAAPPRSMTPWAEARTATAVNAEVWSLTRRADGMPRSAAATTILARLARGGKSGVVGHRKEPDVDPVLAQPCRTPEM